MPRESGHVKLVNYCGRGYPGLILSVDEEEGLEDRTIHRLGGSRFFWPIMDDAVWYTKENIAIVNNPPQTSNNEACRN